ncbi:MAG: DUF1127 domain-containing protein [Ectothiorhodospiraceae bacterium]|jgi:uncharacterized protein YjiS (DUF1127 family)
MKANTATLNRATSRPQGMLTRWAATVAAAIRRYRQRRLDRAAFLNLATLDEATLRDIGYSRHDVDWAASLPLSVNAAQALRSRATAGSHGQAPAMESRVAQRLHVLDGRRHGTRIALHDRSAANADDIRSCG